MIASQHDLALLPIVERDRKHAVQVLRKVDPDLLPEVDDDLRVGVRRKRMALRLELPPQLAKIVNLAVEEDGDRTVLVINGLVAAGHIYD